MTVLFDRRKFLLASSSAAVALSASSAHAQGLLNALKNFIWNNYDRSLRDLTNDGIREVIRRVQPIADDLQNANSDLREHFENEWAAASSRDGRSHTSQCPYCITVAKEVERRVPTALASIPNRTPDCFVINGNNYAASNWGTLHSIQNGSIGPAVGAIWFSNGQYYGRGYNGSIAPAQPGC